MSDALERLKNRQRPTVPDRDTSITPTSVPQSRTLDTSIPRYPDMQVSLNPEPQVSPAPDTPALEIKQSTIRLERDMSQRLQALCRTQGICREVLIEAMFEYCESHPDALDTAIATAKIKHEQRQQVANLKRAKSMMEKFR